MREKKCRLILKGEVVGYEKHKGGLVWHSEDGKGWSSILNYDATHLHYCYIDHDDEEWFTGKLDKDGTEIYEGDRTRRHFGEDANLGPGTVYWHNEDSAWHILSGVRHTKSIPLGYYPDGCLEVMGRTEKKDE